MARVRQALLAGAALLLLAGCTTAANASYPSWVPSPNFGTNGEGPGVDLSPIIPVPQPSSGSGTGPSGPSGQSQPNDPSGSPRASSSPGSGDPLVVATHLNAPTGVTLLPDGTALVGERTSGRIVRVQPRPNQPVLTVRTLTGIDLSGDGGLLDLALSPTYDEDSLIYAYITTKTDNRVVDFTLTGPVTPVLTGIPRGTSGNTGRIAFGATGELYIGTGDAGHPSLASNPNSLAGKVLRVTDIGTIPSDNPSRTPVWTSGHRVVNGLCTAAKTATMFEVEPGAAGAGDEVNLLAAGADYGWPRTTATTREPVTRLPSAYPTPGGCALQSGSLWVTSLDGEALLSARVVGAEPRVSVGAFTPVLKNKYGRLRTVVAAPDGALWITTSNKDGKGKPVADDERVIRYLPSGGGGGGSRA